MRNLKIVVTIPADKTVDGVKGERTFTVSGPAGSAFLQECWSRGYETTATLLVVHDDYEELCTSLDRFEKNVGVL